MTKSIEKFYSSITNSDNVKDAELVSFFVYYISIICGHEFATVTSVSDCFKKCDLRVPTRIAPYPSEGLISNPQKFIKVNGGYKLQRHYREELSMRINFTDDESAGDKIDSVKLTADEQKLIEALARILPSAEMSYRQALIDLSDNNRASFRGTALELREVLRETLDHFAPDLDVESRPGFQLEKGRHGPTMKQKVRFIFQKRGIGKTKASSPEDSVVALDAMIGELTRSVYQLGSIATHIASEHKQVAQIKRYTDAVLHDLLDANAHAPSLP
jgi:hypothetical protein